MDFWLFESYGFYQQQQIWKRSKNRDEENEQVVNYSYLLGLQQKTQQIINGIKKTNWKLNDYYITHTHA